MDVAAPNVLEPALSNFLSIFAILILAGWGVTLLARFRSIKELMQMPAYRFIKVPALGFSLKSVSEFRREHLLHAVLRAGCDRLSQVDSLSLPFSATLEAPATIPLAALPFEAIATGAGAHPTGSVVGSPVIAASLRVPLKLFAPTCLQVFWGVPDADVDALTEKGSLGLHDTYQASGVQAALPFPVDRCWAAGQRTYFSGPTSAAECKTGERCCAFSLDVPSEYLHRAAARLADAEEPEKGAVLCVVTMLQVDAMSDFSSARTFGDIHMFAVVVRVFPDLSKRPAPVAEEELVDDGEFLPPPAPAMPDAEQEQGEERLSSVTLRGEPLVVLPHRSYVFAEVYAGTHDDSECVVCMTEQASVVLLPCRHLSICTNCVKHLTQCPVCRASFSSHVIIPSDSSSE